jgi:hypothetical protein
MLYQAIEGVSEDIFHTRADAEGIRPELLEDADYVIDNYAIKLVRR